MNDNVKRMRNGEKIKCPRCKDGYFSAVGDPKTANVFRCDTCETGMVLTLAHTWKDGKLVIKDKER